MSLLHDFWGCVLVLLAAWGTVMAVAPWLLCVKLSKVTNNQLQEST